MVVLDTVTRRQTPGSRAVPGSPAIASASMWQLQRVAWDQGPATFTVDLHSHLTVVRARPEMVDDVVCVLLGAVQTDQPGVHAEIEDGEGRALVVFRPHGAPMRVVDVDSAAQVSRAHLDALTAPGESVGPVGDDADVDLVLRLAAVDQATLWESAAALAATGDNTLDSSAPSLQRNERGPRRGLWRRRQRDTAPSAAAMEREAALRWQALAGDVDVRAASARRAAVDSLVRVRARLGALAALGAQDSVDTSYDDAVVARAVCRMVPADGPSSGPHVVALQLSELDGQATSLLLDTLAWLSASRQIVVVSAEDAVAEWVRLEAHARRAALVDLT